MSDAELVNMMHIEDLLEIFCYPRRTGKTISLHRGHVHLGALYSLHDESNPYVPMVELLNIPQTADPPLFTGYWNYIDVLTTGVGFYVTIWYPTEDIGLRGTFMAGAPMDDLYLFFFHPCVDVQDGLVSVEIPSMQDAYYWSFWPDGREPLSAELLDEIIPPQVVLDIGLRGKQWSQQDYQLIRDITLAKGLDPESSDLAIQLGCPLAVMHDAPLSVPLYDWAMFKQEAVANFTNGNFKTYRKFLFPPALADPQHDPYFSIEGYASWITDGGLDLFNIYQPATEPATKIDVDDVRGTELREYRALIVPETYQAHPFFSLDNAEKWVLSHPFMLYQRRLLPPSVVSHRSSRATSRAASETASRSSSCVSRFFSSSRAPSPPPTRAVSSAWSSRQSSVRRSVSVEPNLRLRSPSPSLTSPSRRSVSADAGRSGAARPEPEVHRGRKRTKGKAKLDPTRAALPFTREEWVGATFRLRELFQTPSGGTLTIDALIKQQDQDSWALRGSGGHSKGDVWVHGFSDDPMVRVWTRRINGHCSGVDRCELASDELFADCERYEPDAEGPHAIWVHELDANEREATSAGKVLLRFFAIVCRAKCKKKGCTGQPTLVLLANVRIFFSTFESLMLDHIAAKSVWEDLLVGCSEYDPSEPYMHIYVPIPANVDETQLKFVLENDGRLPNGLTVPDSDTCVLSTHPRLAL
ncbi:hypothetical protein GGX14DRAFT_593939, partial [Mycena pura]